MEKAKGLARSVGFSNLQPIIYPSPQPGREYVRTTVLRTRVEHETVGPLVLLRRSGDKYVLVYPQFSKLLSDASCLICNINVGCLVRRLVYRPVYQ
jgi:hypothetical protein